MNAVRQYLRELGQGTVAGWNRFWFAPADPATLGLVRIAAGAMLCYTHLVWSLRLADFFGPNAWVSPMAARYQQGDVWAWSYWWWIDSTPLMWLAHAGALLVFVLLTVGLFSRVMSVLAFLISVAYVHRVPGALFGLDQINVMLAMYLMVGPSGDAFSLDRRRAARRAGQGSLPPAEPSTGANLAMRLIQVHMCIIYFFAGLSKLQGNSWWYGDALWGAFANLEYQSIDMTWLCDHPFVIAAMTQTTVFWELLFPVMVWPRLARPVVLAVAVPLHLGIGIFLGMWTFGLVMLIGCLAFVSPTVIRNVFDRGSPAVRGAAETEDEDEPARRRAAVPRRAASATK